MKQTLPLLLAGCLLAAPPQGLPVRGSTDAYAAHAEDKGIVVASEIMDPEQIRHTFSTNLGNYVVLEVAVWPKPGETLDLDSIDFALRTAPDRAPVRPASIRTIARVNQKRGQSRRDDIVLYPSVGVSTGSWGTGTNVGVGVGMGGGGRPGPASTDRDRQVMETELTDRSLPEGAITKPVAGYLYFPLGAAKKRTGGTYELHYELNDVRLRMELPVPKKS